MRVGSDVQAKCRKCGEVWHLVIAVAAGSIAQVECAECGARHRYRPTGGGIAPRKPRATTGPTRNNHRKTVAAVEADLSRPRRPFRITESYDVGDRIVHASFGEGVVQEVRGASKIEVLFDVGPKTLVQGRSSG